MHGVCARCEMCPIRHRSVCGVLSDEELSTLSKMSRRKLVQAHHPIFHEGDEADQYFNVVRGIIKLVKTLTDGHQHIIGLVYPPEFLGEPWHIMRSYSAEAATDVELCGFPRAPFEKLMDSNQKFKHTLFEFTLRELDICRNWTLLLARKSAHEKVASFLYMIASRVPVAGCKDCGEVPVHFHLPFTRAEMADYLGLTLETVSRQLSQLKAKKVIEMSSSRDLLIPDLELLAAIGRIDSCTGEADLVEPYANGVRFQ